MAGQCISKKVWFQGLGNAARTRMNFFQTTSGDIPESNDDPEIMARYMAELEGMPRTPWGLHTLAKLSVVGAVIDVAVAAGVLHLLSLVCEVSLYSTGRQRKNYYSIAGLLLVLALLAVIPSVAIADAWSYALVAFACVVVSIIVTGIMLSRGYD